MSSRVTITDNGRDGQVCYSDGLRAIEGYWSFGGGDVVAIVSMGTRVEWEQAHPWALEQRAHILRAVADEVVRQRAPTCTASIDPESGDILLRKGPAGTKPAAPTAPQVKARAFVRRYTTLKAMFALGALAITLLIAGVWWAGKKVLTVAPASGVPLGSCVRTDRHIASLVQTTDPHLPNWSGRGGNETTSISMVLIPLDGAGPLAVPLVSGLSPNAYALSRIMGSDGRTLWCDAGGLYGVRLSDHAVITTKELRSANPSLDPAWWEDQRGMDIVDGKLHLLNADHTAALDIDPATLKAAAVRPKPTNDRFERPSFDQLLVAGFLAAPGTWIGLHAQEELAGTFKVGAFVRAVERAEDAEQLRHLCAGRTEASSDGNYHKLLSIGAVDTTGYLNAAFLRVDGTSAPLRIADPESVLMLHTDKPGLGGVLMVSRVDLHGRVLWSVNTGLDRFALQQVLPGTPAFAFVGTRPPIPGKLSEPLVVLVDIRTGTVAMHSLWR